MSYVYENHVFHYLVQDGITYLCLADSEGKRRVAFAFLEDIRRRFDAAYGGVAHTVQPFELNAEFSPTLERQVNFYNSDPASDDLSRVKSQLDDVKSRRAARGLCFFFGAVAANAAATTWTFRGDEGAANAAATTWIFRRDEVAAAAAATTWTFRGDNARRRRGDDVDIP